MFNYAILLSDTIHLIYEPQLFENIVTLNRFTKMFAIFASLWRIRLYARSTHQPVCLQPNYCGNLGKGHV